MKDNVVYIENFKKGFYALEDTTKAPIGSLRVMKNAQITDRGGIAPRPGTLLLGTKNTNGAPVRGLYNFRKSFGQNELLIKPYDDEVEVYSKNHASADWFRVKDSFALDKEFGFVTSLVNVDNEDYVSGCNRNDPYFGWSGSVTQLNGALVGAETEVTVDSTLVVDVYDSKTASSVTTTTVDISTTPWANSQWVNFYILITSGASSGKVSLITANDNNTLTFNAISGLSGTPTFEIRKLAFPATGTIIYNGTTIAYTAITTSTTFTVASAHSAPDRTAVTLVPTEYPGAPRGNRLANYLGRTIVGNVRSALARDSGGALQGYSSAGSYFVSKLNNPFDFNFSAARVAGEGDIIGTPYGGGDITDVKTQENAAYVFKKYYIESVKYSQDANDLAVRDPLKSGIGSVGKVTAGRDDLYFFTGSNALTSIGRVRTKDIRPATLNIGNKIKRYLDSAGLTDAGRGVEVANKVYFPIKSSTTKTVNDVVLVYNRDNDAFEGIWDISANDLEEFNEKYYFGSSNDSNVYQLFYQHADVEGSTRHAIAFDARTHFMNLTASRAGLQAINGLVMEGYILGGSQFDVRVWKDFSTTEFLKFTFASTEDGFLDGELLNAALAGNPFGITPLAATFSDPDSDGRRHFSFRVYFPFNYGNFFSFGLSSSGEDLDYEVTRFGLIMKESVSVDATRIKTI